MKSILAKGVNEKKPFLSVRKKQPVRRRENIGRSKASLLFRNINMKTFYHTVRRFTTAAADARYAVTGIFCACRNVFSTRYGC
jgi:hypothetical protein